MKSTFDADFELREDLNIRDEMRTLETRDDFEFRLLFNPAEVTKQASHPQPDIKRIARVPKNSNATADLADTKEVNRAFLQDTEMVNDLNVTNKFTQNENTGPLSGLPSESYRSSINVDQSNIMNHGH